MDSISTNRHILQHYKKDSAKIRLAFTNSAGPGSADPTLRRFAPIFHVSSTQWILRALLGAWGVKDRYGEPERGSEWEPIKILLERDRGSNKMNTTSNTRLRLTTQAGQDHAATGVLLALGTNNQLHGPENAAEYQLEPHRPTPVRPVSTTGQTGPC
jgi:hypothetical protein